MSTEEKRYESFESLKQKSILLAQKIADWSAGSGQKFDAMVVIPRGGLYPAMVISQMFHLQAPAILSASLNSYAKGETVSSGNFRKGQMPTASQVKGLELLVVDDVFDTGSTIQELSNYLLSSGAASVKLACLYYKPTKRVVDIEPDFFVEEYDGWVEFAWEKDLDNLLNLDQQQIFKDPSLVIGETGSP